MTQDEAGKFDVEGIVLLTARLPEPLREAARRVAATLEAARPWRELLSGIHNPFGYQAAAAEAWTFLDIAESPWMLDRLAQLIGPDIILWDSELLPEGAWLRSDEPARWPVRPLAGVLALVGLDSGEIWFGDISRFAEWSPGPSRTREPHYALRYMPATSRFERDPLFPANAHVAATTPLVNYATRPIWLVRGEPRANQDLSVGFSVPAPQWV